ncbi:hypothetical protein OIO90_001086 [Microbotryomycetes sp. JL221]|nr:hypothetical protein OIO90_001086 [Microbotryomycetes sp. JL221]
MSSPPPAAATSGSEATQQRVNNWFWWVYALIALQAAHHECGWEGAPLRVPDPACARCHGTFVEEISSDNPDDDPRQFDRPDDDGDEFEGGDGGLGRAGPNREPMLIRFIGPGGAATQIAFGGGGAPFIFGPSGAQAERQRQQGASGESHQEHAPRAGGGPLQALMSAFGWAPPGQREDEQHRFRTDAGFGGSNRGEQTATATGAEAETGAGRGERMQQVPLRNLATFLGEAFGPPQAHEADHPRNNPFAEGHGDDDNEEYDRTQQEQQRRAQQHPFAVFAAEGANGAQNGAPLNHLFTLLNAFGIGMPLPGNRGDYVFGEANFQELLNDLMQQAQGRAGPQPATEEIIDKLPRTKVTADMLDSPNFHSDCPHMTPGEQSAPVTESRGQGIDGVAVASDAPTASTRQAPSEPNGMDDTDPPLTALPGGWPGSISHGGSTNDVERSRQASRDRERSRRERDSATEHGELPMDDLD